MQIYVQQGFVLRDTKVPPVGTLLFASVPALLVRVWEAVVVVGGMAGETDRRQGSLASSVLSTAANCEWGLS